ncbi:MAG: conjugative transposon protein TraN [Tunicatimonas sp.]|uniref:conjugative transposon protein TraN n=1 Tax=Tunicatimonas sp. TaxID=1940096 RepID=UPI003C77E2EA
MLKFICRIGWLLLLGGIGFSSTDLCAQKIPSPTIPDVALHQPEGERPLLLGPTPEQGAVNRSEGHQSLVIPISDQAVRKSYQLEASYHKTTHLIFPSRIIYVDLGSGGVIVNRVKPTENVIKVKANEFGFEQTTLVVITEEGKYYPFMVNYVENPTQLNINMAAMVQSNQQMGGLAKTSWESISFSDEMHNRENTADMAKKVLSKRRHIRDVGTINMRMSFLLTGVHVHKKNLFLQIELENRSDIDYEIDFFKFFIKDQDITKRMAYQELELDNVQQHPVSRRVIPHQSSVTVVFAMPMVSYGDDKQLEVQLYERNGGRHLRFDINADVITRAKRL